MARAPSRPCKIEQSSGLSDDEIKAKLREAEQSADDDKKKRAIVEARNEAESRAYQVEKVIKQQGDKLKDSDKQALEAAIAKVREAAKGEDPDRIKSRDRRARSRLARHERSALQVGRSRRRCSGASGDGAAAGATAGQSADDDAIDAEFEVKK